MKREREDSFWVPKWKIGCLSFSVCKIVFFLFSSQKDLMLCNLESERICRNTPTFSVSVLWTEYESELCLSHISPWGNRKKKIYLGNRHKNIEIQKYIDNNSPEARPKSSLTWLNVSLFTLTQLLVLLTKEHLISPNTLLIVLVFVTLYWNRKDLA